LVILKIRNKIRSTSKHRRISSIKGLVQNTSRRFNRRKSVINPDIDLKESGDTIVYSKYSYEREIYSSPYDE